MTKEEKKLYKTTGDVDWSQIIGNAAGVMSGAAFQVAGAAQQQKEANDRKAAEEQAVRDRYPVSAAYDNTTDYMALMTDAANKGDYAAAANYERQRNSKITGQGLDSSLYTDYYSQYLPENRYRYDPSKNEQYQVYQQQQNELFQKLMNREPFSYDKDADPLYQQYAEMYTRNGQRAMRDTMGQAAALTGGYGSTYAQQAGQQSYESYMDRLNDVLPQLYGQAYDRYQNEGNALLNRYNMVAAQADEAYQRGYNDWSTRLSLERADEENAYNRRLNEEQTAYARQQDNRNYLVSLISASGYSPTDAELQAAGMTRGEANALKAAYEQALAAASFSSGGGSGRSGGGSGGRRSSGGGGGNYSLSTTPQVDPQTEAKAAHEAQYKQCDNSLAQTAHYGGTKAQMYQQVKRWYDEGTITKAEADALCAKYGLNASTPTKNSGGGKTGANGSGSNKTNVRGSY